MVCYFSLRRKGAERKDGVGNRYDAQTNREMRWVTRRVMMSQRNCVEVFQYIREGEMQVCQKKTFVLMS